MAESLSDKLAAIKEAQAQKVAEAAKVEEAHAEALEEDKTREAISEAQTEAGKEDALRTELNVLEGDFTAADKESLDAGNAIVEAEQILADPGLDAETREAVKAIIEEGNQKISEFAQLRTRKITLEEEIAAMNGKQGQESAQESADKPTEEIKTAEPAPVAEIPVVAEVPSMEIPVAEVGQPTVMESPEVIQTKKLIEQIKEGRLEKLASIESRNAAARTSLEGIRATGNIEGIDFSQPGMRANLNMILEQKIATPDQILLQVGNKPGARAEFLSALSPAEMAQLKGSRFFEQVMNLAMDDLLSNLQVADVKKSSRIGMAITSLFKASGLYKADKLILGAKFDENKSKMVQIKSEIVAGLSNPDLARGAFFVDPESAAFIFENKLASQEELVGRLKAAVGSSKERNMFEAAVATVVELQEKGFLSEKEVSEVLGI